MRHTPISIPAEDFHTRLLDEHWRYVYVETKQDLQRKIDDILRKRR